jgi:hypothetical protein
VQQAPSIKKRTKQSEPTCRPWQGGTRESGDAVTNSGNEEGQMPNELLPIESFIHARLTELGLTEDDFLRRLGYRKMPKARQHLAQLYLGDCSRRMLVQRLPEALEVPASLVRKAVEETGRQLRLAEDDAYRAVFKPHAVILTERLIPQPIFVAAFIGPARLQRIDFDVALPPESFVRQALDGLHQKLLEFNPRLKKAKCTPDIVRHRGNIPAFGRPTGFVVNYTPDHAVRFDLNGNAVETLERARRIGSVSYSLSGRPLSRGELDAIFGRMKIVSC